MEQENSPQPIKKRKMTESVIGTVLAAVLVIGLLTAAGFYFLNERIAQEKSLQEAAILQAQELQNYATTTVIYQATTTAATTTVSP